LCWWCPVPCEDAMSIAYGERVLAHAGDCALAGSASPQSEALSVRPFWLHMVVNVNRRAQSAGRTRPPATVGLAGMQPRDALLGGIRGTNSASGQLTERAMTAGATDTPPLQWTRIALQRSRLEDVPSHPRQSDGWYVR
jgi:hypothetical protein